MTMMGHCDINLVRGHGICSWCGVYMASRYLHISAVFYRISISMHHDDCGWCRHKGWSSVVVMSALGHYGINLVRGHASCAWCGVYGMSRHLHGRVWSRCRCCYHCYHYLRRGAAWPPPPLPPVLGCTTGALAQRLVRELAPQAAEWRTALRPKHPPIA